MIRKKSKTAAVDSSIWLISYSDLMSAILVVLVMMISFSKVDIETYDHIHRLLTKEKISTLTELKKEMDKIAKAANINHLVKNIITKDGLEVRFSSAAQFKPSKWTLKEENIAKLMPIFQKIIDESHFRIVDIIGHTDSTQMNLNYSKELTINNWSLSSLRAFTLQNFLAKNGLNEKNARLIAYADAKPLENIKETMSEEEKDEIRNKNRRVTIVLGKLK